MPSFEIEFEVYCASCGAGLCNQSNGSNDNRGPRVDVEACENCIANTEQDSYETGYSDGYNAAKEEIEDEA